MKNKLAAYSWHLLKKSGAFLQSLHEKRHLLGNGSVVHVVGLAPWKSCVPVWFPERKFIFYKKSMKADAQDSLIQRLRKHPSDQIMIWAYKADQDFLKTVRKQDNTVFYVEDGFLRSVKQGGSMTPPISIVVDTKAPYFDARHSTDLEDLLNNFDFASQPDLVARAEYCIKEMLESGISKYNPTAKTELDLDRLAAGRKKILVVGQVENDASIQFGCKAKLTNNDLVRLAKAENPDDLIIYKPHPDVLLGYRNELSDPKEVEDIATILRDPVRLSDILSQVDHVYTITSLVGLEALLRGLPVTCLGAPFYSGWGLTDDRQITGRRQRKLTVEQLFAIAYIIYPIYSNPFSKSKFEIEDALHLMKQMIGQGPTKEASIANCEPVVLSPITERI
ncbi:capsular polysaccharide biosynthesis protein [uncultured Cohaesibacter sp.]|uniref:capsular polysaccharide export protein, LipB/KpsS family n=1 Tax=uncultured Cohaesibacter sp. TaxID=1002546 RepID=UPI0029C69D77|nr:capsular polysaccharide biosynthesis protein [uncultured Cohaesibacter sp.]